MSEVILPEGWKWFTSPLDVVRLGIVDFSRLNGYWLNQADAMERVYELLGHKKAAYCEVSPRDFATCPEAVGWTGWSHHGQRSHELIARDIYNWFSHHHPGCKISFSDAPDFHVRLADGMCITGDIGEVSASTFVMEILRIAAGHWWLSVTDGGRRHVIILILSELPEHPSKPE